LSQVIEWAEQAAVELFGQLKDQKLTLATAESLTGGLVGSLLVGIDGISKYYYGGAITYTDAEKKRQCGVSAELLTQHSAVSSQVAKAMAEGIRLAMGTDLAVATTGYAGPGAGADGTPAGTYYIGVSRVGSGAGVLPGGVSLVTATYFCRPGCTRNEVRACAARDAFSVLNRVLRGLP
jgi:PncC family amidohydrolase